jgi:hypothetical protein
MHHIGIYKLFMAVDEAEDDSGRIRLYYMAPLSARYLNRLWEST